MNNPLQNELQNRGQVSEATPLTLPLDRVVDTIKRDATDKPRVFLDGVTVPKGGE